MSNLVLLGRYENALWKVERLLSRLGGITVITALFRKRSARLLGRTLSDSANVGARVAQAHIYAGLGN